MSFSTAAREASMRARASDANPTVSKPAATERTASRVSLAPSRRTTTSFSRQIAEVHSKTGLRFLNALLLPQAEPQLAQLPLRDRGGGVAHQIRALRRFGK